MRLDFQPGLLMGAAVFTSSSFLKEGDLVEAEIERIGKLRKPVKNELLI